MDNNLIEIKGVRGYINSNDVVCLNLEDVARGLGFTQEKNGVEYIRWETVDGYLSKMLVSQQVGNDKKGVEDLYNFMQNYIRPKFIEEPFFYWLAMKAGNKTAEAFQKKVCFEILPEIRRHGGYKVPGKGYASIQGLKAATGTINTLERIMIAQHCTPYEVAQMAENICLIYGVPIPPDFVKEDPQIRFSNALQITRTETTTTIFPRWNSKRRKSVSSGKRKGWARRRKPSGRCGKPSGSGNRLRRPYSGSSRRSLPNSSAGPEYSHIWS